MTKSCDRCGGTTLPHFTESNCLRDLAKRIAELEGLFPPEVKAAILEKKAAHERELREAEERAAHEREVAETKARLEALEKKNAPKEPEKK